MKIKVNSWISRKKLSYVRQVLRECPYREVREEGLACLKNARPNYLANLIPMDHPDRLNAVRWIIENA